MQLLASAIFPSPWYSLMSLVETTSKDTCFFNVKSTLSVQFLDLSISTTHSAIHPLMEMINLWEISVKSGEAHSFHFWRCRSSKTVLSTNEVKDGRHDLVNSVPVHGRYLHELCGGRSGAFDIFSPQTSPSQFCNFKKIKYLWKADLRTSLHPDPNPNRKKC